MRKLFFKGPYNLIAFEVIPALVEAKIMEPLSDEVLLSYRPPVGPDRWVYEWMVEVPEKGALEVVESSEDVEEHLEDSQAEEKSEELEQG